MNAINLRDEPDVLLRLMESAGQDVTPNRASPRDAPEVLFELITDGCGSETLRRISHGLPIVGRLFIWTDVVLDRACRKHDWRYQNGYRQIDKLRADILLITDGIKEIIKAICCMHGLRGLFASPLGIVMLLVYVTLVLCCGWTMCTLFRCDGGRLAAHPRVEAMTYRALMRRREQNPRASYAERARGR